MPANDIIDIPAYLDHIEDARIALSMAYDLIAPAPSESVYSLSTWRLSCACETADLIDALAEHSNRVRSDR